MEISQIVFVESVIAHNLTLSVTGFPCSPPPETMTVGKWGQFRKQLFLLSSHPSTEEFAAEVWTSAGELSSFDVAVGEEYQISFKLTTTLVEGCQMSNLGLHIDPEDSVEADRIESYSLKGTKQFRFVLKPIKAGHFVLKGLRFLFFGVAPVAVTFPQPLSYCGIQKYSSMSLTITSKPDIAYSKLPFRFRALLRHGQGPVDEVYVLPETSPPGTRVALVSPPSLQVRKRYTLDPSVTSHDLEFELEPLGTGSLTVNVFASYSRFGHAMRFVVDSFTTDVRELKKIHCTLGNDQLFMHPDDEECRATCPCALISQAGSVVTFQDVNSEYQEKKCFVEIDRLVMGHVVTTEVTLSPVFASFQPNGQKVAKFPAVVECSFAVLCLGANSGRLILLQPPSADWAWIGKTKYALRGPRKVAIAARMIVMKQLALNIGPFISVVYGNASPQFQFKMKTELM
jgi:hypothetical protein